MHSGEARLTCFEQLNFIKQQLHLSDRRFLPRLHCLDLLQAAPMLSTLAQGGILWHLATLTTAQGWLCSPWYAARLLVCTQSPAPMSCQSVLTTFSRSSVMPSCKWLGKAPLLRKAEFIVPFVKSVQQRETQFLPISQLSIAVCKGLAGITYRG